MGAGGSGAGVGVDIGGGGGIVTGVAARCDVGVEVAGGEVGTGVVGAVGTGIGTDITEFTTSGGGSATTKRGVPTPLLVEMVVSGVGETTTTGIEILEGVVEELRVLILGVFFDDVCFFKVCACTTETVVVDDDDVTAKILSVLVLMRSANILDNATAAS